MIDVIDHLYLKADAQEHAEYKQHWDSIYKSLKEGGVLPITMLSPMSDHMQDAEAARNILSRMAADIARLEEGK